MKLDKWVKMNTYQDKVVLPGKSKFTLEEQKVILNLETVVFMLPLIDFSNHYQPMEYSQINYHKMFDLKEYTVLRDRNTVDMQRSYFEISIS